MLAKENAALWTANLDLLVKVAELAGVAFVLWLAWWRTGSFHYLVHRLFQALGATKAFHSETAQRHWNDYEDLHQHNLWHGLRLSTSRDLKRFLAWLDTHDISIEEASRARWFFNANTQKFSQPSAPIKLAASFSILAVVLICWFYGGALQTSTHALIKVKASGTWFWVNNDEAYGFWGRIGYETWHLNNTTCLFADEPPEGLTGWDQDVICHLVLGNEPQYIDQAISSQQTVSYVALGVGTLLLAWLYALISSAASAKSLSRRLMAEQPVQIETEVH